MFLYKIKNKERIQEKRKKHHDKDLIKINIKEVSKFLDNLK